MKLKILATEKFSSFLLAYSRLFKLTVFLLSIRLGDRTPDMFDEPITSASLFDRSSSELFVETEFSRVILFSSA